MSFYPYYSDDHKYVVKDDVVVGLEIVKLFKLATNHE